MKYLITGGSGYLGGRLVSYLQQRGNEVTIGSRKEAVTSETKSVKLDYNCPKRLAQAFKSQDFIFHLAYPDEIESKLHPAEALKVGGEYTWNICQAICASDKRPLLIYLSTFHVYGKNATGYITEKTIPSPTHPYALGKYFGEKVIQLFREKEGMDSLCVRLSNAFGVPRSLNITRWSLVFNELCWQAVINKEIRLKSAGKQVRNFITLEDTERALEFLTRHKKHWPQDGTINLGSNLNFSILEVAEIISTRTENILGYKPSIIINETDTDMTYENKGFNYSTKRLKTMGFIWENNLFGEIDATLCFVRNAKMNRLSFESNGVMTNE